MSACDGCKSRVFGATLCRDGHNQNSYPSGISHCLRDDFHDRPWPFWLDAEGKPKAPSLTGDQQ